MSTCFAKFAADSQVAAMSVRQNTAQACSTEFPKKYRVGVLTVSDSCFKREKNDDSGKAMCSLLSESEMFPVDKDIIVKIVPDEKAMIEEVLTTWSDQARLDLILTIGGTGFSPRDVTPEATENVCERKAGSLAQGIIASCAKDTPFALLSRATCGIRKNTLIFNLPGSVKGSRECFSKVAALLPHAIDQLRGDSKSVAIVHADVQGHGDGQCHRSKVDRSKIASRRRESSYAMVPCDLALQVVLRECETLEEEVRKYNDCCGHVSSVEIQATIPSPPYRASIKDGYAVIAADGAGPRKVLGVLTAGDTPSLFELQPGGCIRVSTGGPVPDSADAVVQIEDTSLEKKTAMGDEELEISILKSPVKGQDIREIGSDIEKGQIIVPAGKCLSPIDCAVLAAAGVNEVPVFKFPTVAVLSTGDELIEAGQPLPPGCIIDSNRPALFSLLKESNLNYFDAGRANDDQDDLLARLKVAFQRADALIITGGVSMGEKDIVKDVLIEDYKAKIHFGRVLMKPGKPTGFATLTFQGKKKFVFCLPGNPVSAVVTYHLFVVPALRKMMGHETTTQLKIKAKLGNDLVLDPRPEYHRASIVWSETGPVAFTTGNQISSRLLSLSEAQGLMILPSSNVKKAMHKGEEVEVLLLNYFVSKC